MKTKDEVTAQAKREGTVVVNYGSLVRNQGLYWVARDTKCPKSVREEERESESEQGAFPIPIRLPLSRRQPSGPSSVLAL